MSTPACPHCGCETYYRFVRMVGNGQYNYRFDGKDGADNSELHYCIDYIEQKTMYCQDCHKKVGMIK